MKTILFPCEPYNLKHIDQDFISEYEIAKLLGFNIILFSYEDLVEQNIVKLNKSPLSNIIYRGWMLHNFQYHNLYETLKQKYNVTLINSPEQYINCHYFPKLYSVVKNDTPKIVSNILYNESMFFKKIDFKDIYLSLNIEEWRKIFSNFQKLDSDCILKDFVKSEKGTNLFFIKKDILFDDFVEMMKSFIKARGELFNIGLIFKEYKKLKKYKEVTNEWRAFYLNHKLIILDLNTNTSNKDFNKPPTNLVNKYSNLIDSNFFTLDFAELENNEWIILEGGDGQVSGLTPNSNEMKFYNMLNNE